MDNVLMFPWARQMAATQEERRIRAFLANPANRVAKSWDEIQGVVPDPNWVRTPGTKSWAEILA